MRTGNELSVEMLVLMFEASRREFWNTLSFVGVFNLLLDMRLFLCLDHESPCLSKSFGHYI